MIHLLRFRFPDFVSLVIEILQTVLVNLMLLFDSLLVCCFVCVDCFCLAGSAIRSRRHSLATATGGCTRFAGESGARGLRGWRVFKESNC
jgi:hypothetical protein